MSVRAYRAAMPVFTDSLSPLADAIAHGGVGSKFATGKDNDSDFMFILGLRQQKQNA